MLPSLMLPSAMHVAETATSRATIELSFGSCPCSTAPLTASSRSPIASLVEHDAPTMARAGYQRGAIFARRTQSDALRLRERPDGRTGEQRERRRERNAGAERKPRGHERDDDGREELHAARHVIDDAERGRTNG